MAEKSKRESSSKLRGFPQFNRMGNVYFTLVFL